MYFNMANSLRAGLEPASGTYNGTNVYQFHHREFLRLITPQYGCYLQITLTI